MVLFVLIAVGIIVGVWSYARDWGFDSAALGAGMLGGLCGTVVGLVALLIGAAVPGPVRSTEHHVEKLYAFEDDTSIEGHFFLCPVFSFCYSLAERKATGTRLHL